MLTRQLLMKYICHIKIGKIPLLHEQIKIITQKMSQLKIAGVDGA